jgi:hypothetical protein
LELTGIIASVSYFTVGLLDWESKDGGTVVWSVMSRTERYCGFTHPRPRKARRVFVKSIFSE